MSRCHLLLCCLTLGSASPLFSQEEPAARENFFKQLDKDGDGQLSQEELGAEKASLFNRLVTLGDENGDGKLSREEFLKALDKPQQPAVREGTPGREGEERRRDGAAQFFQRLDQNQDGKLTKDELPEPLRERLGAIFERTGKDELTREEFGRAMMAMRPEGERRGFPPPEELFQQLDSNNDGTLEKGEISEERQRFFGPLFERLGKDSITKQEFIEISQRFQGEREERMRRPEGGEMRRPEEARPGEPGPAVSRGPEFVRLLDKDNNGRLSAVELAYAVTLIEQLDRNGDGELDPAELLGFGGGPREGMRRPEGADLRRERPEVDRPQRPRRPGGAGETTEATREEMRRERPRGNRDAGDQFVSAFFDRFDANSDGKISKEEAPDRMKDNFERIDADGDGAITREELMTAAPRRERQPASSENE